MGSEEAVSQMKVFLSFSGESSKELGEALHGWLPDMFQTITPWISERNIFAGDRWNEELDQALRECRIGIICLTPQNSSSPWPIFEAGALSTALSGARVVPYLFGLDESEVAAPLATFNFVTGDRDGTFQLCRSINDAIGSPLTPERLANYFEKFWPDLEQKLDAIDIEDGAERRTDRDLLEEILNTVRSRGKRDLNQVLVRLLLNPTVRSIEVARKVTKGVETPEPALRVTVTEKLPLDQVPPEYVIPAEVFGLATDVVSQEP